MSTTRSRNSNHRSRTIADEAERHLIRPAKRAVKSARRSVERTVSGMPSWVPWAAVGLGLCALIYGLAQIESVREFARTATEPISDLFDDDEEDEDEDEGYDLRDSDYGDRVGSGL